MTLFEDFIANCNRTFSRAYYHENQDGLHAALILATEAGEVLDLYKKGYCYGKPIPREKIRDEVGDVLYGVAMVLHEAGVSLDECLNANFLKLRERYPNGFDAQRAINKDTVAELTAQSLVSGDGTEYGWDDQGCYFRTLTDAKIHLSKV